MLLSLSCPPSHSHVHVQHFVSSMPPRSKTLSPPAPPRPAPLIVTLQPTCLPPPPPSSRPAYPSPPQQPTCSPMPPPSSRPARPCPAPQQPTLALFTTPHRHPAPSSRPSCPLPPPLLLQAYTGARDGQLRIFDIQSSACVRVIHVGEPIRSMVGEPLRGWGSGGGATNQPVILIWKISSFLTWT